MTEKQTDEQLMRAYQQGDFEAFKRLYLRYEKRIYNYLLKYTGEVETTNDLFQEVFFKVHKARDRYEPYCPFAPWIFTIAANTVKNEFKRKYRWQQLLMPKALHEWETGHSLEISTGEGECDPEQEMLEQEVQEKIQRALACLPDGQRNAIILNKYLGFSYGEIAEINNVTTGSIKQKIHRGYETLKKLLRDML